MEWKDRWCDYQGAIGGIFVGMECSVSGLYQGQHPSPDKTVLQYYKCYHWGKQGKGYMGPLCVLSYNYNCLRVQTLIFSSHRAVLSEATVAAGGVTGSIRSKKCAEELWRWIGRGPRLRGLQLTRNQTTGLQGKGLFGAILCQLSTWEGEDQGWCSSPH